MRSCSFVKFRALIVMLEHSKYHELTRGPCWTWPNFDVFDHFLKVKVAEILRGVPTPNTAPLQGWARSQKHHVRLGPERLRDSGLKGPVR